MFVPQAVRISEQGEEMGGEDGVILLVCLCFRSVKQCQPLLRQCVCECVCVCECISDTRHNYLVIFVKILILILQQVLHCFLTVATEQREKREGEIKCLCNSYSADKH